MSEETNGQKKHSEETKEKIRQSMMGKKNNLKGNNHLFSHVLTPEERKMWVAMDVDVLSQLDYDIRILTIRERRMLERIMKLEEATFVEVRIEDTTGLNGTRPMTQRVVTSESNLVIIQQIEEALTRVQEKKARLVEAKHRYERDQFNNDEVDVQKFVDVLGISVDSVWSDEDGGDGEKA